MTGTTSISSVQEERLKKRFAAWDSDNDGQLERSDFEQEALDTAASFGKSPDAAEINALRQAYAGMFERLAQAAGVQDGLTEAQFLQVAGDLLARGDEAVEAMLQPVTDAVVGIGDRNADGVISESEFVGWLRAIGKDESDAQAIFRQLDSNGNGQLSRTELLAAVRDFHLGRSDLELLP